MPYNKGAQRLVLMLEKVAQDKWMALHWMSCSVENWIADALIV